MRLGIAATVLGLLLLAFVASRFQRAKLVESTVRDAVSSRERRIELPSAGRVPRHENGFECLSEAVKSGGSLGSFDALAPFEAISDGGVVPES
ncbi:MAG TPA: hypothetical protein VGD87_08725, partial [Archangium sp.]